MVSRELDYSRIGAITDNNLQSFLENNNTSYFHARQLFNSLSNNNSNPLANGGISANKDKFIIILLEKILRNTENILSQNSILDNKILDLENLISQSQNLEPIILAGNKITEELNNWHSGFQLWNDKFKNFEIIFDNWNIGFQQLENNFNKLEILLNNSFQYWDNNNNQIESNLKQIEKRIYQWNLDIGSLHENINNIENKWNTTIQNLQSYLQNIEVTLLNNQARAQTSSSKSVFCKLPNNNHKFTF